MQPASRVTKQTFFLVPIGREASTKRMALPVPIATKRMAVQQKVLNPLTQPNVCASCHKSELAQIHRFSRHPVLEGKVTCSNCHNVHGSDGPKLLVKETVNQTCYTCHAEKRGPFLGSMNRLWTAALTAIRRTGRICHRC
jgi:predicted CXXCH cytochrome family protein